MVQLLEPKRKVIKGYEWYEVHLRELCEYLNVCRDEKGYSYRELAKESGLSATCCRMVLSGRIKYPRFATIWRLARSFGMTIALTSDGVTVKGHKVKR